MATEGLEEEIISVLKKIVGPKGAPRWLNRQNELLGGIPREMIHRGEGQKVLNYVLEWEGRK